MADNISVTPGTGAVIAAENLSGALVQRVKVVLGALDTDGGDISSSNPIPAVLTAGSASIGSITNTAFAISGSLPAGTNAIGSITNTAFGISGSLPAGTNALGSVTVSNFPATQPVSGTVTVTQATASSLNATVTGTVAATQSGTWNINNVSGTVSLPTGAATSANQTTEIGILNTIATNTGAQATDTLQTGTIAALNGNVAINAQGAYTVSVNVAGTWSATLVAEGLMADGTTWTQLPLYQVSTTLPYSQLISTTINGQYLVTGGGYTQVRIRASAYSSGTANIALDASLAQQTIFSAQLGSWTVQGPGLTKGSQGATGFAVQDLKDAGRNVTNYFMALPVLTTNTDTLQSLTGYKSGAAVGATTTPAVVTSGKTYRITNINLTYVAIATAGTAKVTLRANTGGTVVIGSPAVNTWTIGGPAATAGVSQSLTIDIPDGLEFAAGTGIGISVQGLSAIQIAAAVGYVMVSISGYEY